MVQPSISQHRSPKVARIRSFCSAGETNWSPETTRPLRTLMSGATAAAAAHAASKGRNGSRKIKASPGRSGVQDQGVAREVGRYRQPAPRLPHHEGERPGRRIRQEEVQGAPRGGQRGRRVERRRARLRRHGAVHPYMQRLGLRARRGVVELRLPARRPLQRGDRRPLRRTEEGRASSEPSSWITCTGTTTSGSTRRWATCRRSSSERRGRPSRNRPNKCCQSIANPAIIFAKADVRKSSA